MHSATHQPSEASTKAGYEVSDMKPGIILFFFVALLILMVIGIVGGMLALRYLDATRTPLNAGTVSPLATEDNQVPQQMPYLQGDPVSDRRAVVAEQKAVLDSYAWVSDAAGMERARLPIAVAMEHIADGKAAYRQAPQAATLDGDSAQVSSEDANQ